MNNTTTLLNIGSWIWWGGLFLLYISTGDWMSWAPTIAFPAFIIGTGIMGFVGIRSLRRRLQSNKGQGKFQINLKTSWWRHLTPVFALVWVSSWLLNDGFLDRTNNIIILGMIVAGSAIYVASRFLVGEQHYLFFEGKGIEFRHGKKNFFVEWSSLERFEITSDDMIIKVEGKASVSVSLSEVKPKYRTFLADALRMYEKDLPQPIEVDVLTGEF